MCRSKNLQEHNNIPDQRHERSTEVNSIDTIKDFACIGFFSILTKPLFFFFYPDRTLFSFRNVDYCTLQKILEYFNREYDNFTAIIKPHKGGV